MRAYRTHPTHKFQILCDSFVGCVPEGTHAVAWRLRLAESSAFSKASCKRGINRGKACANAAVPSCATSSNQSCSLIPKSATSWSGSGKDSGELLAIRIAALFRLLRVGFVRLPVRRLSAHRIPQRRHMLARPAIRTIAAPILNVQITIQLQPYRIVFRTAHLRPITPSGSFLDIANLALLKIQQSAFGDMGQEQVERVDTGHGLLPRSC